MSEPNEVSDHEAINAMIEGGERVADHAAEKWTSGKFDLPQLSEEENHARRFAAYKRWRAIKSRIRELAGELRKRAR